MKIYKKCTAEPHSFLVNDTTLQSDDSLRLLSDDPLRFIRNLSK